MSKIDEVRSAMMAAMKAKDKERKDALSALLTALKNKAIDKRADLTEEEETQVILKEIKQLKETIEMTPADRTDILTECNSRLAVLEEYAPKMMDEAEIKAVVSEVLTSLGLDAPTAKEKGIRAVFTGESWTQNFILPVLTRQITFGKGKSPLCARASLLKHSFGKSV